MLIFPEMKCLAISYIYVLEPKFDNALWCILENQTDSLSLPFSSLREPCSALVTPVQLFVAFVVNLH